MLTSKLRLNNIKLRNKLLIIYIFSVFLPIVLTNVIFYRVTMDNMKTQKMADVQLVLDQVSNEFITTIDQAVGISTRFYTDSHLYNFFDEEYDTVISYLDAYDIYLRGYNRFSPLYYSIQSITFYTDNQTVLFAGGVRPITQETEETFWYKQLNDTRYPVIVRTNPSIDSDLFSVISKLDYFKTKNVKQKIIKIDINPLTMKKIFGNIAFSGSIYLINDQGIIEYSTDTNVDWQSAPLDFDLVPLTKDTIFLKDIFLPTNYFKDWRIVGTITQKEILEELYNSRRFIIILASITFILPTFIIVSISRSLHVRLLRILKHMKKMKNQDFVTIKSSDDKDEIGELIKEFNRMSRTIKKLINDVYKANLEKKDLELKEKQAQLSALQSQINPHFLFNALETIRMRSIMKDEKETAKIIQNMANIFRNSLTWRKEWVSVREELKLVDCFLEIQKYRFGEKLEYIIEVDEAAYDCVIPNLAFLPFVENASIHGIEAVKEKGKIHIKIEIVNNELIYTIRDNGAGMSNEELAQILEGLENDNSMGESVGIKNVYYRLKLYYKDDFDFVIESKHNSGTTVIIKLMCRKNQYI